MLGYFGIIPLTNHHSSYFGIIPLTNHHSRARTSFGRDEIFPDITNNTGFFEFGSEDEEFGKNHGGPDLWAKPGGALSVYQDFRNIPS
jgi:hypothetical protein